MVKHFCNLLNHDEENHETPLNKIKHLCFNGKFNFQSSNNTYSSRI